MTRQNPNRLDLDHIITRRKFLGTTALSSAALLTGGITSLVRQSAFASHGGFDFVEKSIPELQAAMASGELTSKDLVKGYLDRIQSLNSLLHSVIETNPNAVSIAQHLDNERRGGSTNNAYDLSYTSWGSSSGSGNGAAANLCAAAIGTETDGSITGPSAVENIVGLKPTLGLVSQDGIIPIAHEQDTAGPMARSVTDIAILLGVLQSPFGEVIGHDLPSDYTQFLDPNALDGAVIGRDVRFFDYSYYGSGIPGDELTVAFAENALSVMESLGATVVDVDTGDVFAYNGDEFTALLYEFRAQIADY